MSKKIRNLIILVVVITILFILYKMFVASPKKADNQLSSQSQVQTQKGEPALQEGQDFLNTLNILENITLDDSVFRSDNLAFNELVDYSYDIGKDDNPGRPNPFLPLGIENIESDIKVDNGTQVDVNVPTPVLSIKSLSAIDVGRTSAKLRGEIPTINTGDLSYFEWGTDVTNLSLHSSPYHQIISSFAYIATGLAPHTKYYFRAVVKNGDKMTNGEIMSFTTLN